MSFIVKKIILFLIIMILNIANAKVLFNFEKSINLDQWRIVDDVVMGGRSSSSLIIDGNGYGVFSGWVSLENYGGFCSIRCKVKSVDVKKRKYIYMEVLGDNKYYQLRIRSKKFDRHVYVKEFYAKNVWQTIRIPLADMKPQFRGRQLNMKNYSGDGIVEVGILIGNKVEENFSLSIKSIHIE